MGDAGCAALLGVVGRMSSLEVRTANEATCADLQTIFGARGDAHTCQCQRYRLERGEAFRKQPLEERRSRLKEQTSCGDPQADSTSGLVAYLDGEPVGWCAIAPRRDYVGMVRNANMTAWVGRHEDRADPGVWALTCLKVRNGFTGRGVSRALVAAAVPFARDQGAVRLEAYPVTLRDLTWGEAHPGHVTIYEDAGFAITHRPSKRRAVVSISF